MGLIKEFKKFAIKGNVIDLAVGIVIGAAFSSVVKSLVEDILMPPIGAITRGVDFTALRWVIKNGLTDEETVAIRYGDFIQEAITFLIVAWAVFLLVRLVNALRKKENEKEPDANEAVVDPKDIVLLTEIRDLLKENKSI